MTIHARTLAIGTSVLSTTAVPAVLALTGTWTLSLPAPDAVRQWIAQPVGTGFVTALTATGAVAMWLLLATAVLTHAYRALGRRLRWIATLHLPGPFQSLTAALLGATAVTTATGATAHAAPVTHSSTDLAVSEPATAALYPPATGRTRTDPPPANGPAATYTVRRGDSLCRIAEQELGDADRWPEIYALNRGARFPRTGGTLQDPNLIYPGWTLALPADATPPTRQKPRTPVTPPPSPDKPDGQASPSPPGTPPTSPSPRPPSPATPATPTRDSSSIPAPAPTSSDENPASPAAEDTSGAVERATRGVWLPSGSWVDIGLALAITAAVALVWAHRRHRYVPRNPTSAAARVDDPDLAPMPRVVGQIRRGLRRAAAGEPDPYAPAPRRDTHDDENDIDDEPAHTGDDDRDADASAAHAPAMSDDARGVDAAVLPVVPALDHPFAARWPAAGLGLTGPGAQAAARGFLTAALATGGVNHPQARTEVIIPSPTAATLLDAAAADLPRTPRLTITTTLDDALNLLEAQTMRRTRLVCRHDVDSVAELRRTAPHEAPLPPIMLLAEATDRHERARIAALLAQGQHLDIHGILLGAWPEGDTITVAADGTTATSDESPFCGGHPADPGRLAVLGPTEAVDLLTTLAESHTGQPPAPTDQQHLSHAHPSTPHNPPPPAPRSALTAAAQLAPQADSAQTPAHRQEVKLAASDEAAAVDGRNDRVRHLPDDATAGASADTPSGQVRVRVLGTPAVIDGDPQRTPRAKSLELLVYLAVHDGAASTDAILDDLLPDAPSSKAHGRLYTYVSGLRAVLRHTGGPRTYLSHPNHRYLLHPDTLDIDLWRMREAIREASHTTNPHTRTAALRRAVDAYTGPLAQDCDYEWIEPYREAVRQEAIDAHLALADTLTDDPAQQLAVLDAAIAHHPHHEPLYQQAMRARAELGHLDAIRTLRRQLTRALAEIDAEPRDDTLALADRLIAAVTRSGKPSQKPESRTA
ncbi:BTAD domain-containing putative transcriptional regulator [Micromonospora mangrovi]|uniref:BTAD domain-containing putative transcriptional regulator n=2 Tax=Micromonospora TaxID=1873 RepID=A0AAU7MBC0_9ACTN